MSRRMACVSMLLCAAAIVDATAAERRPNVLLVVSDDQGYGDVGCYGAKGLRTPRMDALAATGLRFTQFRVNPLCAPTRASLLSGQYSLETGMWRGPSRKERGKKDGDSESGLRKLRDGLKLLPQLFHEAGYATGMFGKWHLGYEPPDVPNSRGFDQFVGFLGGSHPYEPGRGAPILRNGEPIRDDRHLTDLFTDEAIAFIEKHREQPFFCYVPYNAVHGPMWSPDHPRPSGKPEWLERCAERGLDFPRRDYCAVLEHLDDSLGRLLATLRRWNLEENTLVIFVSDNGAMIDKYPGSNGPLRGEKGMTYEGGLRVPAMMRWPGVIPAGSTSDAPAMVFDLFATCLDAAGIPIPPKNADRPAHGVSLLKHARSGGKEPLPERYLFWDLWGKLAAYHDGWKLVGQIDNHRGRFAEAVPQIEAAQFELYYLPNDLAEQHDLAKENPAIYADLKQRLVAWFKQSTQ